MMKKRIIILAVLVVLLIGGVVVGVYANGNSAKDNKDNESKTTAKKATSTPKKTTDTEKKETTTKDSVTDDKGVVTKGSSDVKKMHQPKVIVVQQIKTVVRPHRPFRCLLQASKLPMYLRSLVEP